MYGFHAAWYHFAVDIGCALDVVGGKSIPPQGKTDQVSDGVEDWLLFFRETEIVLDSFVSIEVA